MTAPCADVPELMFTTGVVATEAATRLCAHCPLTDRCRELGADATWGVWAGEQKGQAVDLLLLDQPEPVVEVVHSRSAYNAKAHGDCPACARRNAEWVAQWRARGSVSQVPDAGEQLSIDLGMSA